MMTKSKKRLISLDNRQIRGRGGKRLGAGRPLTGSGKSENFSARLTPETRKLLESEARRRGKTLSVTAESLLRHALEDKAATLARPLELRALMFLIEEFERRNVKSWHKNDPQYQWWSNPYLFESLRKGIAYLMSPMRPEGEIAQPPAGPAEDLFSDGEAWSPAYPETPDEHAREIAREVIGSAQGNESFERGPFSKAIEWNDPRHHYAMMDAAKTLLTKRGKK
jgi:hypothetical protein